MAGDSERIRELIRAGETSQVEFKASFRFDLKDQKVNKDLTQVVVKTIAGFSNSEGGTLFIGVNDDGQIFGIERDIETLTRKSVDGFEQALRTAIGRFIGVEVSTEVKVRFVTIDGKQVAEVACQKHAEPVFLKDGDQYTFYVRDGNSTRPLNVVEQHKYIRLHYATSPPPIERAAIKEVVNEVLAQQALRSRGPGAIAPLRWGEWLLNIFRRSRSELAAVELREELNAIPRLDADQRRTQSTQSDSRKLPPWLTVRTRNVLDSYLSALERSTDWKRLHIVSPWLSILGGSFSLTSKTLAERLEKYGTTVYVVTRPPTESWHQEAIDAFASTGRANIALVADLHSKLYVASTAAGSFALVGSANFTQQSAENLEIGLLVQSYMEGKKIVSALDREAAEIYRIPGRKLIQRAQF